MPGAIQASALRAEIDAALHDKRPAIDLVNGLDGKISARAGQLLARA